MLDEKELENLSKEEKRQLKSEIPHSIDASIYGKETSQKELEENNLPILLKVFGEKIDNNEGMKKKYKDMKERYSKREVIEFFDGVITKERNGYEMNEEILKQLVETGRLVPAYGNKYSKQQLLSYFLETEVRPSELN